MSNLPGLLPKLALASATSANGTARNGAALSLTNTLPGSVSAIIIGSTTTASVIATFKWQVSNDNTTYYDYRPSTNVAPTATAAGTGVAVPYSFVIDGPSAMCGYQYARLVATLSGAATASADVTAGTYRYVQYRRNI